MAYFSKELINSIARVKKLNIINSISGIKPGNLIGTKSNDGQSNLAIISSVVHLASSPACIGFMMRPSDEVRRHTNENILENGWFTINHIHSGIIPQAHYTSAKFDQSVSEFEASSLGEEYLEGFYAPFVRESRIKFGLRHVESIPIKTSNTTLIVGEVEHLFMPDEALNEEGYLNLEAVDSVGISGLNSYYQLKKIVDLPYASVNEVPRFYR